MLREKAVGDVWQCLEASGFARLEHGAGNLSFDVSKSGGMLAQAGSPGKGGRCGLRAPSTLKRAPIPDGDINRPTAISMAFAWAGLAAIRREARSEIPSDARKAACVTTGSTAKPRSRQQAGEILEIDMRRQIGLARRTQGILVAMRAHGLQRIADGTLRMAIVDQQHGNAWLDESIETGQLIAKPAKFDDVAVARSAGQARDERRRRRIMRIGPEAEDQLRTPDGRRSPA